MSAKSCLLCGKPLGRMRPGAGSEFCSREHRNQYRLRRSMDCLTEANKVATLARRRESLKPLVSAAVGAAVPAPRGTAAALSFASDRPARPELRRAKLGWKLENCIPRAGMAPLLTSRGAAMKPRRECAFHLMAAKDSRIASCQPPASRRGPARLTAPPAFRKSPPRAQAGNAVRVPARAGFRPAAPVLKRMKIVRSSRSIAPASRGRILHLPPVGLRVGPRICRVDIRRPSSWAPSGPSPAAIRFVWPGTAGVALQPTALASAARPAGRRVMDARTPALPPANTAVAPGSITAQRALRLFPLALAAPARLGERRLEFQHVEFPVAPEAPAQQIWVEAAPQKRRGLKRGGV